MSNTTEPAVRHPNNALAILYVFLGGVIGTGIRAGLCFLQPDSWHWPWIVFLINICGAFLLGLINAAVSARSAKHPGIKMFSTFAGTGIMGAFTTYGTFVHETDMRFLAGLSGVAIAYAIISIIVGILCAGLGLWLGHILFDRHEQETAK